jgi:hypothetical protein
LLCCKITSSAQHQELLVMRCKFAEFIHSHLWRPVPLIIFKIPSGMFSVPALLVVRNYFCQGLMWQQLDRQTKSLRRRIVAVLSVVAASCFLFLEYQYVLVPLTFFSLTIFTMFPCRERMPRGCGLTLEMSKPERKLPMLLEKGSPSRRRQEAARFPSGSCTTTKQIVRTTR